MNSSKKWYERTWTSILFLIFFFPVGLFLMWKYTTWPKAAKWAITGFFGLVVVSGMFSDSPETATSKTEPIQAEMQTTEQTQVAQPTTETIQANNTPAPTQVKQVADPTNPPATSETVSQKNAVRKAQSYLSYSGFSRDGLVAQLEYEQFSNADAQYGADNAGADWMEEAAEKAKSYMEYSAFSRGSLIEQLKYEKFTQEQAEHGANSVGL